MKIIGLIGGMSYSSTITYYEMLNKLTSDHFGDLTTPKILLSSVNFGEIEKLQVSKKGPADFVTNSEGIVIDKEECFDFQLKFLQDGTVLPLKV